MASPSPSLRRVTMADLGFMVAATSDPNAQHHFMTTIPNFTAQPYEDPSIILHVSDKEVSERRKTLIQNIFAAILRQYPTFIMHQAQLGPLLSMEIKELEKLGPRYKADEVLLHIENHIDNADMIAPSARGTGRDTGGSKSRGQKSVDEARARDSDICTVTRLAICHMAHIIPFSATSTKDNVKRTERAFQSMSMMLSAKDFQELLGMIEEVKGCEKPENLFALNPALHGLMDRAYLAFEVFDVKPRPDGHWDTVLKFHFLPLCKTDAASSAQELNDAIEKLERRFAQVQRNGLPARAPQKYPDAGGYIGARLKSGEWLRSGHLFTITHPNQKAAELCATFFRWQWACARIWCIRGGAEPQELRGGNDDDDDGWKLRVRGSTDDLQHDVDADARGLFLSPTPPVTSLASAQFAHNLPQVPASETTPPPRSNSPAPATPRPARKFPQFRPSRYPVSPPRDSPSPDFSSPSRKGGFRDFFRRFSKVPQPGMEAPEPPTPAPMDGEHHGGGTIGRVSTQIRRRVSDIFGKSREDVPGGNA